jgi:serine/threonine protein kinase
VQFSKGKTFGRYKIAADLAAGGMASVFRALYSGPSGFEKEVALKVMHEHLAKDPHHCKMFEEEARTGAMLRHRCVVETLDFGVQEGLPFLATEFLDGLTLETATATLGRLPPDLGIFVLGELLDALAYAHALKDPAGKPLGLVHRDISPQNIFLTRDGRVKLIDFGIAFREGRAEETRTGILKGKFRYMAPEQAGGAKVDGRTDVYSAALVVLAAMTGKKPHLEAEDTRAIILAARQGIDLEASGALSIPEEFRLLLEDLLQLDPEDRLDSAQALPILQGLQDQAGSAAGHRALARWLAPTQVEVETPKKKPRARKKPEKQTAAEAPDQPAGSEDSVLGPMGMVSVLLVLAIVGMLVWALRSCGG